MSLPPTPLLVRWLGRISYQEAAELQKSIVAARRRDECTDTLLLLEHSPVVTLGKTSHADNVLLDREQLARQGIELIESTRGGDVTYHGPGQLVGYPILSLEQSRRDAHRYLRDLEEALIRVCADQGIKAGRVDGLTGAWVEDRKVAAIGVRLSSGWITSHGFALNVDTDLSGFQTIVPCGISDRGVTSLKNEGADPGSVRDVAALAARRVAEVFERSTVLPDEGDERLALTVADAKIG